VVAPLLVQAAFGVLLAGQFHPQGGEQVDAVQVEGYVHGFGVGEGGLHGGVIGDHGHAERGEGQHGPAHRPEQEHQRGQGSDGHGRGEADGGIQRVTAVIDEGPALLAQERVEPGLGGDRIQAVGPSGAVLHGCQDVSEPGGLQEVIGPGEPAAQLVSGRPCLLDRLAGQFRALG
jgi:hypothetical protein